MAKDYNDIPKEGLDTPSGRLYRPLNEGWQILVVILACIGGPLLGGLAGKIAGDLSETAQTFLYVPMVAVFLLGYALWVARLHTIAFDSLGKSVLKTLFLMLLRRQRPKSLEDVMPSKEKLLEMAVRAQKAGASFAVVGWPVGIISGLVGVLSESAMGFIGLFAVFALPSIAWGYLLGFLGRRGWLPIMDEG